MPHNHSSPAMLAAKSTATTTPTLVAPQVGLQGWELQTVSTKAGSSIASTSAAVDEEEPTPAESAVLVAQARSRSRSSDSSGSSSSEPLHARGGGGGGGGASAKRSGRMLSAAVSGGGSSGNASAAPFVVVSYNMLSDELLWANSYLYRELQCVVEWCWSVSNPCHSSC